MMPICIEALSKRYSGKRGRNVNALQNLDLAVKEGEIFGFLGPNGAGKSTTIKCLVGQILPTSGTATIFGLPVANPVARRRIGYLPENPSFYDFLTAQEYLEMVGRLFGMAPASIRGQSAAVLERLDLASAARRPIRGYSKGMVQRLGLAQTLLHDPDLFILDEPMSGLDPIGRALVKSIMLELRARGKTVFFSTHVMADVEAVCDRVAVIVGGVLQAQADVRDLLESGVIGYEFWIAGESLSFADFPLRSDRSGAQQVSVPRSQLARFLAELTGQGGRVVHMEPQRRSLEDFFLEVVNSRKP